MLAGLEIQEAVQTYGAGVQRQRGVNFSVRCGIDTGLVVVGNVGGSQHMEYSAMGDAVNLCGQAHDIVDTIAQHLSNAELKTSFLNMPAVRTLMEGL